MKTEREAGMAKDLRWIHVHVEHSSISALSLEYRTLPLTKK